MLRLPPKLYLWKIAPRSNPLEATIEAERPSPPSASPGTGTCGGIMRTGSGRVRDSTRITSAPSAPRMEVACAP